MGDVLHYLFVFLLMLFLGTMGIRYDITAFIIFPFMIAGYMFVLFVDALIREW